MTIAVLTSLMVVATPVSGETLAWSSELGMPSTSATKNHLVAGSNITDLAVADDGSSVWAVTNGVSTNYTLKSTDGGGKWTRKSISGLTTPQLIAVAPDDPDTVVVVGDTNEVYSTTDGGTKWYQLTGLTLTNVYCVDISPASLGKHYVAVGGNTTGVGADIAYFNLGASVPVWVSAVTGSTWSTYTPDGTIAFKAVEFSPSFASDKVMVAVSEQGTGTVLYEIASLSSKRWNDSAGFQDYDGTKNVIGSGTNIAPLQSASISLSPTYLGADDLERVAIVGLATNAADTTLLGGIYRMKDESDKRIGSAVRINSVGYDGTNVVAGTLDSNSVYRCADPLATTPTVLSASVYQRPGGESDTVVSWAGVNVVAGTQGIGSAFSVSEDNGKTFNDLSVIATAITNINDIAISADGSKVYMVTDNGTDLSVWRKASSWERVLSIAGQTGYIIRIAPEDADHVYVASTVGTTLYYSNDAGETKWMLRALPTTGVVDLAVESAEVAYVLKGSNAAVYKSTNAGFIWGSSKATGLGGGATIVSLSEDNLIVGGNDGGVAYSKDGSADSDTWKKMTYAPATGSVQVAATGLEDGDTIIAADDTAGTAVKRWKLGTNVTTWTTAHAGLIGSCRGMLLSDGTLYALTDNSSDGDSRIYRTFGPTTATSSATWTDDATGATLNFNKAPQALKISAGSKKLWAINSGTPNKLYTFEDTTADSGPTVNVPAADFVGKINPVTGRAADVIFSWSRLSKSEAYKLEIAYDTGFKEDVTTVAKASTKSTVVVPVGPYQGSTQQVEFMPGTTYYWRVSATEPVASGYSEVRSFSIAQIAGVDEVFEVSTPAIGATDVSVMPTFVWKAVEVNYGYEFVVSEDPTFALIDWGHSTDNPWYATAADEALDYSTTYHWRVRAITGETIVPGGKGVPTAGERGPWVVGMFTTKAEPVEVAPPVIIEKEPAPPAQIKIVEVPKTELVQQAIPAGLLWAIIGIGAVLVIALIVLIVRTRRVA